MTQTPSTRKARKARTIEINYAGNLWVVEAFTPTAGDQPATVTLVRVAPGSDNPVREVVSIICHYCDQPAMWASRESSEVLCRYHVDDHHDKPTVKRIWQLYRRVDGPNAIGALRR